MADIGTKRIYFEEADRPPPSYYDPNCSAIPQKKILPFAKPDPEEWLKAPEFVPRSRLAEAFDLQLNAHDNHVTYPASFANMVPAPLPGPPILGPSSILPQGIPPGYLANLTHINAGGTPIPAIVLRKKRRKRNRQKTNSMALNSSESPCSSQAAATESLSRTATPDAAIDEQEEHHTHHDSNGLGGSCPDLTDEQMQMWDDYLYESAVATNKDQHNNKINNGNNGYEVVPPCLLDLAEQHVQGISNPEIRKLDKQLNGDCMTSSVVMKRFSSKKATSDASTEKSLADELESLQFRPPITKYGYPQIDATTAQVATFHPEGIRTRIVDLPQTDSEEDRYEEDCFEGMNITVNSFDHCDDLTLSDIENTTRFEQIQQAIRRNTMRTFDVQIKPPERVCCVLM